MRLDKLLSMLHYGSRKEIKEAIKDGLVTVNGTTIKHSNKHFDPKTDDIYYDNEKIFYDESIIIMMHKPKGYVSANYDAEHNTVIDLLEPKYKRLDVHVIGRLDIDTEGLLLLTNDGVIIHKLIHPKKNIEKVYEVTTQEIINNIDDLLKPMSLIDGNNTAYTPKIPRVIEHQANHAVIGISEGKFHQVKRMFKAIGHKVTHLKRVQIHTLTLDSTLALGAYRVLTDKERMQLLDTV